MFPDGGIFVAISVPEETYMYRKGWSQSRSVPPKKDLQ